MTLEQPFNLETIMTAAFETFRNVETFAYESGRLDHVLVYQCGDFRKVITLTYNGNYKMSSEYESFMPPEQLEEFENSGYCGEDWDGKLMMSSLEKMEEMVKLEYLWRMEEETYPS